MRNIPLSDTIMGCQDFFLIGIHNNTIFHYDAIVLDQMALPMQIKVALFFYANSFPTSLYP